MTAELHCCHECGSVITSPRRGQEFCCTTCRQTFNNRRMQRGAELYDLFRAMRRNRKDAQALAVWTAMCRLELQWQQEDETTRPGRKSYMPPRKAISNLLDKGSIPRGEVLVKPIRRAGRAAQTAASQRCQ